MPMYTPEQESVLAEVKDYTDRIDALVRERAAFMDASMPMFSKFRVGDPIHDRDGVRLGVVTRLYRFQASRNPLLDTGMSVDCEFRTGGNCLDNTSRHGSGLFGFRTADELRRHHAFMLFTLAVESP